MINTAIRRAVWKKRFGVSAPSERSWTGKPVHSVDGRSTNSFFDPMHELKGAGSLPDAAAVTGQEILRGIS